MDIRTRTALRNVLHKEANVIIPTGQYLLDAIYGELQKRASSTTQQSDGVQTVAADCCPGDASAGKGMEDKNSGYGKTTDKLEDDPTAPGAMETGKTIVNSAGAHITTEETPKNLALNKAAAAHRHQTLLKVLLANSRR